MNEDKVQRIVEEVVFRLQRRAQSNIALSTAQLRDADSRKLFSRYGNLRILLADLPLLRGIAEQNDNDIAAIKLHYALALGGQCTNIAMPFFVDVRTGEKAGASAVELL